VRRLLSHREARIYLAGQTLSLFGDSCLWLAMGIWVKTLTHSNAQAGLVFFFFTGPSLLAPLAGLLVDRLRRGPVLILTNAATGLSVLALLVVHGRGQVWVIDVVMCAYGVSAIVLGPAQSALLTVIVPSELLPEANAALRTVQEGLRLVGPLTGAALFVAIGGHSIAILDAATFAFPIASLLLLNVHEPAPAPTTDGFITQLTAGMAYVRRTTQLRQAILAGACCTAVFGFAETIIYAVVGDGLHRPAAFVGVLVAIQGAGAVLGGLTAAPLIRRVGELRLMGVALLLTAAGALLEIPPFLPAVIAGVIVFGAAVPWLVVALISIAQRLSPPQLQGRVFAAAETLISTPQTISIALGAALIGLTGYRVLLVAIAAVTALDAGYLLTRGAVASEEPSVPKLTG
jgi:MFS family permease